MKIACFSKKHSKIKIYIYYQFLIKLIKPKFIK